MPAGTSGVLLAFSFLLPLDRVSAQPVVEPEDGNRTRFVRIGVVTENIRQPSVSATLKAAITAKAGGARADRAAVEIVVETDVCTGASGAEAARHLVAAQVAAVIGHPCANAALAAANVYAAARIPFVAFGVRHPDLTDRRAGPFVYRLAGRDDRQAADTVMAISQEAMGKRVAVVHDRTRHNRRIAEGVARGLERSGAVVTVYPIVAGEKGYDDVAAKLAASASATIYLALFPAEALLLTKSFTGRLRDTSVVFSDTVTVDEAASVGRIRSGGSTIVMRSTALDEADALAERAANVVEVIAALASGPTRPSSEDIASAIGEELAAGPAGDAKITSYRAVRIEGGTIEGRALGR